MVVERQGWCDIRGTWVAMEIYRRVSTGPRLGPNSYLVRTGRLCETPVSEQGIRCQYLAGLGITHLGVEGVSHGVRDVY